MLRYNNPIKKKGQAAHKGLKLSWDDIRAIQDLYNGPKSSRTQRKDQMRGDYSATITLSASRILVRLD